MIPIDKFIEISNGILPIPQKTIDILYSPTTAENINYKLRSKLWRMNHLYKVVDVNGNLVTFVMNEAQLITYLNKYKHYRLVIVKSRQLGITTLCLVDQFDQIVTLSHRSAGLLAQDRPAASKLLERAKILLDNCPLLPVLGLKKDKKNDTDIKLNNNSIFYVATSFRSAMLTDLHGSEIGRICNESPKKAVELFTGTLQTIHAYNYVTLESTAEGDNEFKDTYEKAKKVAERLITGREKDPKEFFPQFLNFMYDDKFTSNIDMDLTEKQSDYFEELNDILGYAIPKNKRNAWVQKYNEIGDYIYQEYPATDVEAFRNRQTGYYFAKLFYIHTEKKDRIKEGLFNKEYPVQIAMDIGMNDYNCIGFFQTIEGGQLIMLNEYYNYNEGVEFYVSKINEISKKCGYNINSSTNCILPHDGKQKEHTSGITIIEKYQECGLRGAWTLATPDFMGSVEMLREQIIRGLWFEKDRTEYLVECLKRYTKEWDAKTNQFKRKPKENEYYHGADMMRYAVLGANKVADPSKTKRFKEQSW